MADDKLIKKPLPEITPVNQPFWDGAKAGKLMMQKCQNCGTWVFCPRPVCGECASDKLEWVQVSGKGKIFSFTVIREVVGQALRGFGPDIPYVTAWIDLDEGPRFCSNLAEVPTLLNHSNSILSSTEVSRPLVPTNSIQEFLPLRRKARQVQIKMI